MNEIKIHLTTVLFRKDSPRLQRHLMQYMYIFTKVGDHKWLLYRGTLSSDLVFHGRSVDFLNSIFLTI